MRAGRTRHPGRRAGGRSVRLGEETAAVSPLIGAILMFAIFMMAGTSFRGVIVPDMDERREIREMALVADRLAMIKSDGDRQLVAPAGSVATVVPLRAPAPPDLLSNGAAGTAMRFIPASRGILFEAPELRVQTENGTTVFGANEAWTNISGASRVDNILEVKHLRVRIQDPQAQTADESITLTVYNEHGAFAGDLRVYLKTHPSGYSVNIRVRAADLDVLYDQGSSYFNQDKPPFFWVDTLADEVQFADVLGRIAGPFSLQISEQGLVGAFTIVYVEASPGGPILVGSGGKLHTDWSRSLSGGALHYIGANIRFMSQDFFVENGGVVVEQPVGDAFFAEPGLEVAAAGNRTLLRLTVPTFVGHAAEVAGPHGAAVAVQARDRETMVATATSFSVNVTTSHPHVWGAFWRAKLSTAGVVEGTEYAVSMGPDWARLGVAGAEADPASRVHDVAIELQSGSVALSMKS